MLLFEHDHGVGHAISLMKTSTDSLVIFDSAPAPQQHQTASAGASLVMVSSSDELRIYLRDQVFGVCARYFDVSSDGSLHWQALFVEPKQDSDERSQIQALLQNADWWKSNSQEWLKYAADVDRRLDEAEKASDVKEEKLRGVMVQLVEKTTDIANLSEKNRKLEEENQHARKMLKHVTEQLLQQGSSSKTTLSKGPLTRARAGSV